MSPAADGVDDLDPVALGQRVLAVAAARHHFLVHFDGDLASGEAELVEQGGDGGAGRRGMVMAIEHDSHGAILSRRARCGPARRAGIIRAERGCSSMVELQLPKLLTWVRFPSPAPTLDGGHGPPSFAWGPRPATEDALATPLPLGWREWLALPDLGITAVRAKVDTGARSSSLHVESQHTFERDGVEWVRFELDTGRYDAPHAFAEAPVLERRKVTDSGGHQTERIFILTRMRLAGQEWQAEVNLAQRRNMLFPMLLGRTALSGRFVVDPSASFLQGDLAPDADA